MRTIRADHPAGVGIESAGDRHVTARADDHFLQAHFFGKALQTELTELASWSR